MKCVYLRYLPVTLSALLGLASISSSAGVTGLEAMQTKIASILSAHRQAVGRNVLFSASDCYSKDDGLSVPLAPHLREIILSSLEQNGFKAVKPDGGIRNTWVLSCRWKRKGDHLAFTFIATARVGGKRAQVFVLPATISVSEIKPQLLQPDMASYSRTLVRRLAENERAFKPWRVYVRPFEVSGIVSGKRSNEYFYQWMRRGVEESSLFIPADPPRELAMLSKESLRLRGIWPRLKEPLSLTADLLAVERQIQGNVSVAKPHVQIQAELIGQNNTGQPLLASVQIPLAKLPPEVAADLISKEPEDQTTAVAATSYKGLKLELATSRGEGTAIYRDGSQIQFLVRVNRPAYVYLFDLNSRGEAVLLYPTLGVSPRKLAADKLLLLPDDGMPYELVVSPPYGKDLVWAVASETGLVLPEKMQGDWTKASRLRERLLAASESAPQGFAEAQLVVQTTH
ncbi:MAG: DUF4384 domain-containing protein [Gammaproteobacteria bacterium]